MSQLMYQTSQLHLSGTFIDSEIIIVLKRFINIDYLILSNLAGGVISFFKRFAETLI